MASRLACRAASEMGMRSLGIREVGVVAIPVGDPWDEWQGTLGPRRIGRRREGHVAWRGR